MRQADVLIAANCQVDVQYSEGLTALMLTTKYGHRNTVGRLLNAEVNLSIKDKNGNAALFYAQAYNYTDCANLLKGNTANTSYRCVPRHRGKSFFKKQRQRD